MTKKNLLLIALYVFFSIQAISASDDDEVYHICNSIFQPGEKTPSESAYQKQPQRHLEKLKDEENKNKRIRMRQETRDNYSCIRNRKILCAVCNEKEKEDDEFETLECNKHFVHISCSLARGEGQDDGSQSYFPCRHKEAFSDEDLCQQLRELTVLNSKRSRESCCGFF